MSKIGFYKQGNVCALGDTNKNLIDNTITFNGWSIGSGWIKKIDSDGSTINYQFTRTGATANNWIRIIPTLKINGNDYPNGITISMDLLTPDKSVINQKCLGSTQTYQENGSRIGCAEPQWDLTNIVNGKWSRISYLFPQSYLLVNNTTGATYAYTQFSFQLVQNGDITIRRIKAEAGNKKTPFIVSDTDAGFTNSSTGFIERGILQPPSFYKDYIESSEFIEY